MDADEVEPVSLRGARHLQVRVYGATVVDMELAALDMARDFFGPDARLEIVPDYLAYVPHSPKLVAEAGDRKYVAGITVREMLS
jgi:hypothetical protein